MNFLCPACRTPLPATPPLAVVPCSQCGVEVDLARVETAPGTAKLWPDVDLSGEQLGELRLERRIGAGGMGAVYEAQGPTGRCAVKVLSALLAAEPELRTRFRREAAALRAIEHEGVVRILSEGEERGFCYYAMERVEGQDLRSRLLSGPLAPADLEQLALRLLSALERVHERGFVHRDIKPGNILLGSTGAKLCDFGIARFDGSTTLTESAAMLGSLRYMAPEQRYGKAGPRSDLYSLGMVLHECVAGGVPGEAELPGGIPGRLRRLIEHLVAERPEARFPSASSALAALRRRRRWPAIAAGATASVLLAAGGLYLGGTPTQGLAAVEDGRESAGGGGASSGAETRGPPEPSGLPAAVSPTTPPKGGEAEKKVVGAAPAVTSRTPKEDSLPYKGLLRAMGSGSPPTGAPTPTAKSSGSRESEFEPDAPGTPPSKPTRTELARGTVTASPNAGSGATLTGVGIGSFGTAGKESTAKRSKGGKRLIK
ncbi:MAG: protein kinase [Myxococcales bacterium]|nr:protein kinase [Myxococcales bacterium]